MCNFRGDKVVILLCWERTRPFVGIIWVVRKMGVGHLGMNTFPPRQPG